MATDWLVPGLCFNTYTILSGICISIMNIRRRHILVRRQNIESSLLDTAQSPAQPPPPPYLRPTHPHPLPLYTALETSLCEIHLG